MAPSRPNLMVGVSATGLDAGWAGGSALLDADFAAGRFFFGQRYFASEAAFLAGAGGTLSGSKRTIGPYDVPGAPELVTNGSFSGGAQLDLAPENPTGTVVSGTRTVNADGSLTLAGGTTLRFFYPLASLTNGKTYQFTFDVTAISGGAAVVYWTDVPLLPSASVSVAGPVLGYRSRATYDSTYRYLAIVTPAGVAMTIRSAPLLHAEEGSVAGWVATSQLGSPSLPVISPSGFGGVQIYGNGANIPGMTQAIPVLKGHAYRLKRRNFHTDPTMIRPTSHIPGSGGANIYLCTNYNTAEVQSACFSAPIDNAYVQLCLMENSSTATRYSDDVSVREVLPCPGFVQGGLSGVVKGTTPAAASGTRIIFQADSASSFFPHPTPNEVDYLRLVWDASKHLRLIVAFTSNGTVEQANLDLGVVEVSTPFEVCFSAAANAFRAALRGGPIIADTSGDMPGLAALRIGGGATTANDWTGGIDRVTLLPSALSAPAFAIFAGNSSVISAWGDSLTASAGASAGNSYPAQAGRLLDPDRSVVNLGIGGQTSTQIAARMGATPIAVTLSGDHIPASGGISVPSKSVNILYNSGIYSGTQTGWIAGVYGTMSTDASGNWSFTRASDGSEVAVPPGTLFLPEWASLGRRGIAWLWLGRNGATAGFDVLSDIAAAVAGLGHDRYLVGGLTTSSSDNSAAIAVLSAQNAALAGTYGGRFVDLMAALRAANDGSANDLADIAAGHVPRSRRSDAIHLNDLGYGVIAAAFTARTLSLGW